PTPTTPHLLTTNTPPPPTSTLFPYTTLFRSPRAGARPRKRRRANRTVARFPSQEFQLGSGRHAGGAGLRSGREELWPAAKGRRGSAGGRTDAKGHGDSGAVSHPFDRCRRARGGRKNAPGAGGKDARPAGAVGMARGALRPHQ